MNAPDAVLHGDYIPAGDRLELLKQAREIACHLAVEPMDVVRSELHQQLVHLHSMMGMETKPIAEFPRPAMSTGGGYSCLCPACGYPMRIRSSKEQTPTFKTMYSQCSNIACSGSYVGALSWQYALSASGMDSPRITLPLAPAIERMKALQDNRPQSNQLDLLDMVEA